MSKAVKNWQVFGIISGLCFLYSLVLPFRTTQKLNAGIQEEYGYILIKNKFITSTNYALNSSMIDSPFQYISNYLLLISMIVGLISILLLLWTSVSGNAGISILSSIIYALSCLFFIYDSINSPYIISTNIGYYLFVASFSATIFVIIMHSYSK
jgi:hypothetical protein